MKLPPPKHLTQSAAHEWKRIVQHSQKSAQPLTEADIPALTVLATTFAIYFEAQAKIDEQGTVVVGTTGTPIKNPYMTVQKECWDRLKVLLPHFGLTPDARAKANKSKEPEAPGELEY